MLEICRVINLNTAVAIINPPTQHVNNFDSVVHLHSTIVYLEKNKKLINK